MALDKIEVVYWFYDDADESAADREAVVKHNDLTFNGAVGHYCQKMHQANVPQRGDIISVSRDNDQLEKRMTGIAYFVDDRIFWFESKDEGMPVVYLMLSPSETADLRTGMEGLFGDD